MNNPINALRLLIGNTPNPKQVIEQMVKTNKNPMIDNLLNMARTGNSKGVEEMGKLYCVRVLSSLRKGMSLRFSIKKFL